jgi:hypothetical protein
MLAVKPHRGSGQVFPQAANAGHKTLMLSLFRGQGTNLAVFGAKQIAAGDVKYFGVPSYQDGQAGGNIFTWFRQW